MRKAVTVERRVATVNACRNTIRCTDPRRANRLVIMAHAVWERPIDTPCFIQAPLLSVALTVKRFRSADGRVNGAEYRDLRLLFTDWLTTSTIKRRKERYIEKNLVLSSSC